LIKRTWRFKMNNTNIEWTDFTWNPVTGCLHGCPYCYAMGTARRFYPPEIGFSPHFWPESIGEPGRRRKPAKIFVTSMGDLFGDWVPLNWWRSVFNVVNQCRLHTFQFLTKNPRRLKELNPWPDNCWVGVTATDQGMFDVAVRHLREVKAGTKFVSAEPLLGHIRMGKNPGLDWLIIGAQTGRRPIQPLNAWVDDLVADAQHLGIKIFCKGNLEGYSIREWPA
jgi:protein gp37